MTLSRRGFVAGIASAALARPLTAAVNAPTRADTRQRFDPWIEVDPQALATNVGVVSGLAGKRPIMAVVKNNGYGLGLVTVARVFDALPQIMGLAVVKTEAALALSEAGIKKPVLLLAPHADADGPELVARGVRLSLCGDGAGEQAVRAARRAGRRARGHVYLDTGMSRMGVPYHRALPWLEGLSQLDVEIEGTFMGFTEEPDFDRQQLRRFEELAGSARAAGIQLGQLHAASSHAVYHFEKAHLDLVRPGLALFGAYPSDDGREASIAQLRPALCLRARVVRVERLRAGDSVSYGRRWVAERPTWVATLPVGHADGYPREAVKGARVMINRELYPVIGAVSASHSIVELGAERSAAIGDVATFYGPQDPALHPNAVAKVTGRSVYDILMHLSPRLPKIVV